MHLIQGTDLELFRGKPTSSDTIKIGLPHPLNYDYPQ